MRRLHNGERWAIVLTGGTGLDGGHPALKNSVKCAMDMAGGRRLITVGAHGSFRDIDPRSTCGILVEQPRDCGSAPGVFLALSYIMAHDPNASVMIFSYSHLITTKAQALWSLGWELHPGMMDGFEVLKSVIGTPEEATVLGTIYQHMPVVDFSNDIIDQAAGRLLVLTMNDIDKWDSEKIRRDLVPLAA